jgi:hypothetical protein
MGSSQYMTFIAAIIWGISLVIGGYYIQSKNLALVFGLNLIILYGLIGGTGLFFVISFFGLPSFLMGYMLSQPHNGYYELQKVGITTAVLTVSLFLALAYNFGGTQIAELQTNIESYMQQSFTGSEESEILKLYEEQGISKEEIQNSILMVTRGLINHLPAIYYLQSMFAVILILHLAAYLSRKRNLPILIKKPFGEEVMPWQFAWGMILALSLWLLDRDNMTSIYYMGSNLLVIFGMIALYFGLSSLAYRWGIMNPRSRKWILTIFILASVSFPLPTIIFTGLLGLFDSLLDYRKVRKKEETK